MKELTLYTEEEISILMQALSHYMYNNPRVTEKQWEIANRVLGRMDWLI
jgi:hypothetical protein